MQGSRATQRIRYRTGHEGRHGRIQSVNRLPIRIGRHGRSEVASPTICDPRVGCGRCLRLVLANYCKRRRETGRESRTATDAAGGRRCAQKTSLVACEGALGVYGQEPRGHASVFDDLVCDILAIVMDGPIEKGLMCLEQRGFASAKVPIVGDRDRCVITSATIDSRSSRRTFSQTRRPPNRLLEKLWQFASLLPTAALCCNCCNCSRSAHSLRVSSSADAFTPSSLGVPPTLLRPVLPRL